MKIMNTSIESIKKDLRREIKENEIVIRSIRTFNRFRELLFYTEWHLSEEYRFREYERNRRKNGDLFIELDRRVKNKKKSITKTYLIKQLSQTLATKGFIVGEDSIKKVVFQNDVFKVSLENLKNIEREVSNVSRFIERRFSNYSLEDLKKIHRSGGFIVGELSQRNQRLQKEIESYDRISR